jgi:hypothetical protein
MNSHDRHNRSKAAQTKSEMDLNNGKNIINAFRREQ